MISSLVTLLALAACGDPAPAEVCVAVDRSCTPAYDATFDNIFQKTLRQSCALAGPSCHAAAGQKAGLVLDDADTAYRLLLERRRAIAGKPECSLLVRRIQSTDTSFMMPPGMPLAPAEQCAIIQWMSRGALR